MITNDTFWPTAGLEMEVLGVKKHIKASLSIIFLLPSDCSMKTYLLYTDYQLRAGNRDRCNDYLQVKETIQEQLVASILVI